ncbi:DNA-binding MarR family transcriptional regulator [Mycobacterium frederiksbergense]|uniref:DNA-binding MarR family transcriptional regulator n=1 Tax=Mycolicibacterium frederiksbergense TaxID=117567 RepID=A0ABT6L1S3_9MYCO|nr:MarR family transcriptional regulator [Mycolicibacterium frederiksbergense]MDH6196901.1 DNA-binding MarR family transcriptional regulator [Mycolicibacterium frederiksbergense]
MSEVAFQEQSPVQGPMDLSDDEWRNWMRYGESAELLYQEIDDALVAKHDLTFPDVQILHRLNSAPRRCERIGSLAEALVLSPSRVSWLVRRLEDHGLVRRVRSREDRRMVVVGITRKGQEYLRPALRTYAAIVRRQYLAPLTRGQMTALGDSTRRVGDALKGDVRKRNTGKRRGLSSVS